VPSLDQHSALRRRPRPKLDAKQMILGTPRPSFRHLLSFVCKEIQQKLTKSTANLLTQQVGVKKLQKNAKKLQKTQKNCKKHGKMAKIAQKLLQKNRKTA
jgi:hypothetical protein